MLGKSIYQGCGIEDRLNRPQFKLIHSLQDKHHRDIQEEIDNEKLSNPVHRQFAGWVFA